MLRSPHRVRNVTRRFSTKVAGEAGPVGGRPGARKEEMADAAEKVTSGKSGWQSFMSGVVNTIRPVAAAAWPGLGAKVAAACRSQNLEFPRRKTQTWHWVEEEAGRQWIRGEKSRRMLRLWWLRRGDDHWLTVGDASGMWGHADMDT